MKTRMNANYEIIGSMRVNENQEIVLGRNQTIDEYVCWYYDIERDDYFWGRYFDTIEEAMADYMDKVQRYMSRF